MERRLVDRMAERHLTRLGGATPGSRGVTLWWRLLAILVVLPVHLVSATATVGGLVLVATGDTWPLKALGVLLLLVAIATRPATPQLPEHAARLSRSDAPVLFTLVDAVAKTNSAPLPDEILIVDGFNAFATHVGWRRRRVIGLGAPLWVSASPQGRVALLGHELGHFAHGDLTHGRLVGTAEETLLHWLDIAGGNDGVEYDETRRLEWYLMAPLRAIIVGYLTLITWVNAPAHQRQEYLADLDSARAAGTDGAVALLDVTLSEPTVTAAMTRAAVNPHRPDVFAVLSEAVRNISPHDLERRRVHAFTERSRIDDTHPATPLRIQLLQSRPVEAPAVTMDLDTQTAVDAELSPALVLAAKEACERIRYQH